MESIINKKELPGLPGRLFVLILVVMESIINSSQGHQKATREGFNPCCNGINHKKIEKLGMLCPKKVLILVVMESIIKLQEGGH